MCLIFLDELLLVEILTWERTNAWLEKERRLMLAAFHCFRANCSRMKSATKGKPMNEPDKKSNEATAK
jgi:hypothetical protein